MQEIRLQFRVPGMMIFFPSLFGFLSLQVVHEAALFPSQTKLNAKFPAVTLKVEVPISKDDLQGTQYE